MKQIIVLLLLLPAAMHAQINRSATELAKENIQEYVTGKIFTGHSYEPVSYGILKVRKETNPEIIWSIEHRFQIGETESIGDKKVSGQKPYRFMFYLDKKMKVRRAESF